MDVRYCTRPQSSFERISLHLESNLLSAMLQVVITGQGVEGALDFVVYRSRAVAKTERA